MVMQINLIWQWHVNVGMVGGKLCNFIAYVSNEIWVLPSVEKRKPCCLLNKIHVS